MKFYILFFLLVFTLSSGNTQDTFSILAVDPETGEVGSAGATCLDISQAPQGAIVISDILPGKGAIHTQSFYNAQNQRNARARMEAGDSPEEIMLWLQMNDVFGDASGRQYGAVDMTPQGTARAAAFTGVNCADWKGQLVGENYAIQGNILLGPEILDSMEARFLRTEGDNLADRLMAVMQGANIPGADRRCLTEGVSSRSAFIRVARPSDATDSLYLDIDISITPFGVDPIDRLQEAYDLWQISSTSDIEKKIDFAIFPNPADQWFQIVTDAESSRQLKTIELYSLDGRRLGKWQNTTDLKYDIPTVADQQLWIVLKNKTGQIMGSQKLIIAH